MSKKLTKEEFSNRSNIYHNNKYDYSLVEYKSNRVKVCIICPIHGEFWQVPDSHMKGIGCPKCSNQIKSTNSTLSQEEFIFRAKLVHGERFNYSKVKYISSKDKVEIICNIHGSFWQLAADHIRGIGCKECSGLCRKTNEIFIEQANIIHKNLYDYSNVIYINSDSKVSIKCNIHGSFLQTPAQHLKGNGCPICSQSHGEKLIYNWLKENNIKFQSQFKITVEEIARNSNLIIVDFFIIHNEKQYFIEYDGRQHYEYIPYFHKEENDFFKQQRRDRVLNEFCELHKDKVTLIRFKYDLLINDILKILNKEFKNE